MRRVSSWLIILSCFFGGLLLWEQFQEDPVTLPSTSQELADSEDDLIVKVGDQAVLKKDLDWEYRYHTESIKDVESLSFIPDLRQEIDIHLETLREELLSNLIERKLLFAYIRSEKKYNLEDPKLYSHCIAEWQAAVESSSNPVVSTERDRELLKSRLCEWEVIRRYSEELIFSKIDVVDAEILDFYNSNIEEFRTPAMVEIRQIVLASEREAKRVLAKTSTVTFAELARQYSIAPESRDGGKLTISTQGEMPRFFNVAFSMRIGEVRGVLKSTYGFHIIKLEAKHPERLSSLDDVRDKIKLQLLKQKKEKEYQKWVEMAQVAIPVKVTGHI